MRLLRDAATGLYVTFLPAFFVARRGKNAAHARRLVNPARLRLWRNDVFAGLVAAVLTISFGLSYSVLIFSGPLTSLLPYGIAMTFISASVAAAIVALGSTFHFAVAGPESSVAAVTSI
ncbi:MAG: hypothetical protein ABW213_10860, partial [Tardiphaga sp.]